MPNVRVVPIGRKITDTFRRQGFDIITAISPLGATPEFRTIAALADHIGEQYATRRVGSRRLDLYRIRRACDHTATAAHSTAGRGRNDRQFHFRTQSRRHPGTLAAGYLRTMLFTAVLSSVAAEHSARVAAMSLATENADELIGKFTLEYNKSRQAGHHQRTGRPGRRRGSTALMRRVNKITRNETGRRFF